MNVYLMRHEGIYEDIVNYSVQSALQEGKKMLRSRLYPRVRRVRKQARLRGANK